MDSKDCIKRCDKLGVTSCHKWEVVTVLKNRKIKAMRGKVSVTSFQRKLSTGLSTELSHTQSLENTDNIDSCDKCDKNNNYNIKNIKNIRKNAHARIRIYKKQSNRVCLSLVTDGGKHEGK